MAQLDTYSGTWTRRQAAHLLRRTCFGATREQQAQVVAQGLEATLTTLFTPWKAPNPPVDPTTGVTYVDGTLDTSKGAGFYNKFTKNWWVEQMVTQPISVREKLTLFWSNHFATEMNVVSNPVFSYRLLALLRASALGNFKTLTREVTIDTAMLRYLNGDRNTKGSSNENYARELQELFTIGKGPEISVGDYTTYTEQDVRAAAKVLTGWSINRQTQKTEFVPNRHDTSSKTFSERYQNTIIQGRTGPNAGSDELDDLLTMIFKQDATAEYIIKKLYRFYVGNTITPSVVSEVIKPLAQQFRNSGYEIAPVLQKLFASEHFFSEEIIGGMMRSPADLVVGTMRAANTYRIPTATVERDKFFERAQTSMAQQQMDLVEPTNVAGYEAYYQEPSFDLLWLTTATLPIRNDFATKLVLNINNGALKFPVIETVKLALTIQGVEDPQILIKGLNEMFFALDFSQSQTDRIIDEVLMQGTPSYGWTDEWNAYLAAPTNTAAIAKVKTRLDRVIPFLFKMAEIHLG